MHGAQIVAKLDTFNICSRFLASHFSRLLIGVLPFQFRIHSNNNKMWLHHMTRAYENATIQFYFLNRSCAFGEVLPLQRLQQQPLLWNCKHRNCATFSLCALNEFACSRNGPMILTFYRLANHEKWHPKGRQTKRLSELYNVTAKSFDKRTIQVKYLAKNSSFALSLHFVYSVEWKSYKYWVIINKKKLKISGKLWIIFR